MASFPGPKWFAPDYDHLGPWISPGLGPKWGCHLGPKPGLIEGPKWPKVLSWHNTVGSCFVWNSCQTDVTSRHDFLAWTWADQPCYSGSFTPWLPLAADWLTMFDAPCCWRHVKTWRWKWRILDLLKAMPCLRWSLVLRKNDALRIGRKDFVEPVFTISLFCFRFLQRSSRCRRKLA